MQRLLEHASWDTMAAMGTVRDFVAEHLAAGDGATATNTGSAPVAASLGLDDYQYADQVFTDVRGTPGCTPRNLHRLIYRGVQSLAPGATAGITLTLTASAPGTDNFRTYARITFGTDNTYVYGTLTIQ
jgi:hypothetical protein